MSEKFASILTLATDPNSAESGGGHGNKGSDFQRYWGIWRALKLEEAANADFLLLFECIQDVLELDSSLQPTTAKVYQVKKKDSGEWTWNSLTLLPEPGAKLRKQRKPKGESAVPPPKNFSDSVLGKLTRSVRGLQGFSTVEGYFVSNAGCMVPLTGVPNNAAAAQECSLSKLADSHSQLLSEALKAFFSDDEGKAFDSAQLHLSKTHVNPDLPEDVIVALANDILTARCSSHAAQSRPLVRALFAFVSGKGRHTGALNEADDLSIKRGFSKKDVQEAFAALETVPDITTLRKSWIEIAAKDGMPLIEHGRLSIEVGRLAVNKLSGLDVGDAPLREEVAEWVIQNPPKTAVLPFLEAGYSFISLKFPSVKKEVIQAYLLTEGVHACAAPISES